MAPRRTVAAFWKDLDREIRAGKQAAIREGVKVLYVGTLEELARGSPGRGRKYKRGKRGRKFHTASVRGEAPARDTGRLQRAIGFRLMAGDDPSGIVGVKDTAPYAKYLDPETGKPEPRIGRRPFLSSAFKKHEREIGQVMLDTLEQHLQRVLR